MTLALIPMMTWQQTTILVLQIVLVITSIILSLFILLHKGRGGGMSDLFGGGMSTSMGGQSVVERNLDRLTVTVSIIWLAVIIALLVMNRYVLPPMPGLS